MSYRSALITGICLSVALVLVLAALYLLRLVGFPLLLRDIGIGQGNP
jgi:hypothetical protein